MSVEPPEPAAVAATRARCARAQIQVGTRVADLAPVIEADGRLNSLQSISPRAPGGGFLMAFMEPIHGGTCAAAAAGPCDCGAQALLESFVFK
jgi:hypothetical protein